MPERKNPHSDITFIYFTLLQAKNIVMDQVSVQKWSKIKTK